METKEKRNSGLVVVIILLVVALLGSVGYIVYDKVLSKDKESAKLEEKNKNKESKVENDYKLVSLSDEGKIAINEKYEKEDIRFRWTFGEDYNTYNINLFEDDIARAKFLAPSIDAKECEETKDNDSDYLSLWTKYETLNTYSKKIFDKELNKNNISSLLNPDDNSLISCYQGDGWGLGNTYFKVNNLKHNESNDNYIVTFDILQSGVGINQSEIDKWINVIQPETLSWDEKYNYGSAELQYIKNNNEYKIVSLVIRKK